ncbi:hypothetical protein ACFRAQ_08840 [Nocardia sp. NPDC056611]|uniref:hypothetical protein n=1 Tax=Nocardia sp. NPDC056611 TaxID=3345877 RepID=UPI00366A7205
MEVTIGKNADSVSSAGTGRFVVLGDDRELISEEVMAADPPPTNSRRHLRRDSPLALPHGPILLSPSYRGIPVSRMLEVAAEHDIEGVIGKRIDSYPDESPSLWPDLVARLIFHRAALADPLSAVCGISVRHVSRSVRCPPHHRRSNQRSSRWRGLIHHMLFSGIETGRLLSGTEIEQAEILTTAQRTVATVSAEPEAEPEAEPVDSGSAAAKPVPVVRTAAVSTTRARIRRMSIPRYLM